MMMNLIIMQINIQINIKNYKMKEIYFKAETELELFFMMDSYVKGYVENNGLYKELKERYLKEQFLKFNPIGKLVKSKTQKHKNSIAS